MIYTPHPKSYILKRKQALLDLFRKLEETEKNITELLKELK